MIGPDLNFAPSDFYGRVEKGISDRKLPGLSISKVAYSEGGLLSDKRTYLRVIRERFIFDTCAAPFGTEFFFSYRSVYTPAKLRLWHVLFVFGFLFFVYAPLFWFLGFSYSCFALIIIVLTICQVFQTAVSKELADLDAFLLKLPGFGPIYEIFFRKDTYYRQDTRLLYLEIFPRIVQQIIDEMTAKDGIKFHQFERAPVLGELYKPRHKPS